MKQLRVPLALVSLAVFYLLIGLRVPGFPQPWKLLLPVGAAILLGWVLPGILQGERELAAAPWLIALLLMGGTLWQWPQSFPELVGWLPALFWGEWAVGLVGQVVMGQTLRVMDRHLQWDAQSEDDTDQSPSI